MASRQEPESVTTPITPSVWRNRYSVKMHHYSDGRADNGGTKYSVTLTNKAGKRIKAPYFHGEALKYSDDDVVGCLASDGAMWEGMGRPRQISEAGWAEFAEELGYDTDSRSAFTTYKALVRLCVRVYDWCQSEAMWEDLVKAGEEW